MMLLVTLIVGIGLLTSNLWVLGAVILGLYVYSRVYITLQRRRLGCTNRSTNDYIYVWYDVGDMLYLKVGRTNNLIHRLSTFQTANARPIKLIATLAVKNDEKAEAYLHNIFAGYRYRGEWFRINVDMLLYFKLINNRALCKETQDKLNNKVRYYDGL